MMMQKTPLSLHYHKKRNINIFTLIELLIVISIISILASMLLPALNSAKKMAKRSQCSGNMRQMGVALSNYLLDSDSYFPPYYQEDYNLVWNWPYGLASNKYLTDNHSFFCPVSDSTLTYQSSTSNGSFSCVKYPNSIWTYLYIPYGYNYVFLGSNLGKWATNTATLLPCPRIVQVRNPSKKIILADSKNANEPGRGLYVIACDINSSPAPAIDDRHSGGANILWVDGHVSWQKNAIMLQNGLQEHFNLK